MLRVLIVTSGFILSLWTSPVWACEMNKQIIGAKYRITTQTINSDNTTTKLLYLWRNNNKVAHQYPKTHITEIWEKTSNGMLRLVRYFDKYKRGIEYQPNEINHGKGQKDWSLNSQLVSDKLLNTMKLTSSMGKGCDKQTSYSMAQKEQNITMQWLPALNLIKYFEQSDTKHTTKWELIETISDKNNIANVFSSRENYQTTDYIDIGDNESDPFLLSMIRLGFVEHGANGFYDAQGNQLNDSSHKRHQHH